MKWDYVAAEPKPHVHPLVAPNGRVLTRSETPDHPWQRGVWFVVKFVNEENFWEEFDPCGHQRQVDEHTLEWVRPNGEVVVTETRTIEPVGDDALDWTSTLVPATDVVLDRTPFQGWGGYGGLAIRGAGDWTDTRILTETVEGPSVVGEPSRWCDLSGPDAGIAFLDHPTNPRHPVPWYGNVANAIYDTDEPTNFVNAAFLFHEPLTVAAGGALRFRYRLVVHDGPWDAARCEAAWEAFAR